MSETAYAIVALGAGMKCTAGLLLLSNCRILMALAVSAAGASAVPSSLSLFDVSKPNSATVIHNATVNRSVVRRRHLIVDARHRCGCRREREERTAVAAIVSIYDVYNTN